MTHARKAAGVVADGFCDRPELPVINRIGGVKMTRMRAERGGRLVKRTVMEPGGFHPMIIDDVDMDCATRTATSESFILARFSRCTSL